MRREARAILVLYWHPGPAELRAAIRQHLQAIEIAPAHHRIVYANAARPIPHWLRAARYDAVVLHTTFLCMRWSHLFPIWKWGLRWVEAMPALKIAMPQDEYDHADVLDEWLWEWGIDVIFSNFDGEARDRLYPLCRRRASFRKALTGYIDGGTAESYRGRVRSLAVRRSDLVYRASHLPYWFGSHGQLKHEIADVVGGVARKRGLTVDISTRYEDTILGDAWFDFLASGRAVLGCESGSSVVDHRGEVRASIQYLLRADPDLSFAEVDRRMPAGWDSHAYFAISPRHLESVLTKTAQVLVEGTYDGILEAGRHYLPLRRDLSNVDSVIDGLSDVAALQEMVDRTYHEVYEHGSVTYADLARSLEEAVTGRRRRWWGANRAQSAWSRRQLLRSPRGNGDGFWAWVVRDPRRALAGTRLVLSDRRLRQVLGHHLRSPRTWSKIRRGALMAELMVIAALQQAAERRITAGPHFQVGVRSTGDYLRLESHPMDSTPERMPRAAFDAVLLRAPDIVVDHSAIGNAVHHALSSRRWLSMPLAQEEPMVELSRLNWLLPGAAAPALEPLVEGARQAPVRAARRLRGDPVLYTAKGVAALRAVMGDRRLRRIWMRYLRSRELRAERRPDQVLEDLLKLSLALRRPLGIACGAEGEVILTTLEMPAAGVASVLTDVRRVRWDHSLLGTADLAQVGAGKRVTVHLGEGVFEFTTLPGLWRAFPEDFAGLAGAHTTAQRAPSSASPVR